MTDLISDISTLTTISQSSLQELIKKANLCIAHAVFESKQEIETDTEINIGLGKLIIRVDNDQIKYKFIPTTNLSDLIIYTINQNISPLTKIVEDNLVDRINDTYKTLF